MTIDSIDDEERQTIGETDIEQNEKNQGTRDPINNLSYSDRKDGVPTTRNEALSKALNDPTLTTVSLDQNYSLT